MKKITSLCLIIMSSTLLKAQSYIGFLTDNYSGINSVIVNPANITDSRFKTDINLAGASAFISNDYYGVKFIDAIEDGYDFDTEANKYPSADNNAALNIDVMGPAFMFNLNEISSIAVFTRGRSIININEFNGSSAEIIEDETTDDFSINEGDFSVIGNSWAELGITYARTLINKGDKFLKGGLTAKYLKGYGSGYLRGKNIKLDYIDSDPVFSGNSSVDVEGEIGYGRFDNFDNEDYDYETPKANGFGVDLGFIFEWRPNHNNYVKTNSAGESYVLKDKNKYKLKLGLSITDIGGINYKNGREDSYSIPNIEGAFSSNDFEDSEDLQDFLQNQYGALNTKSSKGYKVKLPTALHLNADWSYNAKLYVNLNTDLSLVAKGKDNANRIANIVSLTPRFESKWFSFYLPLSVIENNGFQVGSGLRAGPLYIGSGSAISALTSKNTKGTDAYAGLKIPIYQRRPKDKDEDGIIDKLDECPEVAGPLENNGCPWGDIDEDSILDNVDKCPQISGPKENDGCPWGDIDKDSILDNVDNCPEIFGPKENEGCPWPDTDGDGINDKYDLCVHIPGTVNNDGCPEPEPEPEVTIEVQKTLNNYAKTILFDSGKSSIKSESNQTLIEIIKILEEYSSAKFSIEGHTDSVGSASLNQKLSEERASAVMNFLINNGLPSSRFSVIGFGETKPVANNATKEGRAENRRVEFILVK